MRNRILIVEDNPDNRKLICWILEDEGYSFLACETAEEAFEALEREPFELVLMDISLPGMDGKEATRRLREDPRFAVLPIIALTAHAIRGEEEAILASGVTALITKPIDEDRLMETLRTFFAA